jgi:hypothetical protein
MGGAAKQLRRRAAAHMPAEVLTHIFAELRDPVLICGVARVAKAWSCASKDPESWRHAQIGPAVRAYVYHRRTLQRAQDMADTAARSLRKLRLSRLLWAWRMSTPQWVSPAVQATEGGGAFRRGNAAATGGALLGLPCEARFSLPQGMVVPDLTLGYITTELLLGLGFEHPNISCGTKELLSGTATEFESERGMAYADVLQQPLRTWGVQEGSWLDVDDDSNECKHSIMLTQAKQPSEAVCSFVVLTDPSAMGRFHIDRGRRDVRQARWEHKEFLRYARSWHCPDPLPPAERDIAQQSTICCQLAETALRAMAFVPATAAKAAGRGGGDLVRSHLGGSPSSRLRLLEELELDGTGVGNQLLWDIACRTSSLGCLRRISLKQFRLHDEDRVSFRRLILALRASGVECLLDNSTSPPVSIKVLDGQSGEEVYFKIRWMTPLSKLMNVFSQRQGTTLYSFYFNGEPVRGFDTALDLGIQDSDEIVASIAAGV